MKNHLAPVIEIIDFLGSKKVKKKIGKLMGW